MHRHRSLGTWACSCKKCPDITVLLFLNETPMVTPLAPPE